MTELITILKSSSGSLPKIWKADNTIAAWAAFRKLRLGEVVTHG